VDEPKATSLTSLTFVSSQFLVTFKVFEQVEILAVQHKISPLTNGARTRARAHTHTQTHTFMLTTLHQNCGVRQEMGRKFALQPCNILKILNMDITLNKYLNEEKGRLKLQNNDVDGDCD
jgi:hypothetical protein